MSRSLSTAARAAANAEDTDEVYLILVTISHATLTDDIRVTNNGEDVISNGDLFVALPFDITLPDDPEQGVPQAKLTIDNISREIVLAVRQMTPGSTASVNIKIVLASDPDYVEIEYKDFVMSNVSYDALTVSGDLTIENFSTKPYPAGTFSPRYFGGLF